MNASPLIGQLLFWLGVVATFRFGTPVLAGISWLPYWAVFLVCYIVAAVAGVILVECFLILSPDAVYLTEEKIYGLGYIWGPIDCLGPYLMLGIAGLVIGLGNWIWNLLGNFIRDITQANELAGLILGLLVGLIIWSPIIYVIIRRIREGHERTAWKRKPERTLFRTLKVVAFVLGIFATTIIVIVICIGLTYG